MTRTYISITLPSGEKQDFHNEIISKIAKRFKNVNAIASIQKEKLTKNGFIYVTHIDIGNTYNGITNAQYYGAKEKIK